MGSELSYGMEVTTVGIGLGLGLVNGILARVTFLQMINKKREQVLKASKRASGE